MLVIYIFLEKCRFKSFSQFWVMLVCCWVLEFTLVQLLSCVRFFATPWIAARQASLSITSSRSLLKLTSIESVMPSNHLILCRPLLLPPSLFPSIRVFSNESVLWIRWPKYWSFSLNFSPSNEHSGLISFKMDWLELLAVQGTLKSLLQQTPQFKSINYSVFSLLYNPTLTSIHEYWKTIALIIWTFIGKVMSLLFNTLSRFVKAILLRSKHSAKGFPGGSDSKESACNTGDLGSIAGSERSPGEGNGYPLQYSWLENSMDRRTCQPAVHGVAKSQRWLSE